MHSFSRIFNYLAGWEYIGTDTYDENGNLKLTKFVPDDALKSLHQIAGIYSGNETIYAEGSKFIYKAEPAGNWYTRHSHGGGYLHIYRKLRKN